MHKPLKTNGQSQEDTLPLKTNQDFLPDERKAGTFSAPIAESDSLRCTYVCLKDRAKWLDSETLASFKSHA